MVDQFADFFKRHNQPFPIGGFRLFIGTIFTIQTKKQIVNFFCHFDPTMPSWFKALNFWSPLSLYTQPFVFLEGMILLIYFLADVEFMVQAGDAARVSEMEDINEGLGADLVEVQDDAYDMILKRYR